jgi:hypothetical protein
MMEPPRSRKGALGDQKGPRMEEEVGSMEPSETILWAISSTRLGFIVRYVLVRG